MRADRVSIRAIAALVAVGLTGQAFAGVSELVGKLPADANALITIDVASIAGSPVAAKEGWFDKAGSGKNPLFIPRGSKQVVVATQLNADREVNYGVSLADLSAPISVDRIALSEGGRKETIGGKPAVVSPANAYYIQLDDTRLATVFPADRQAATRLASGYHKGLASPYLLKAIDGPAPLVMAIDADGILSAGDVHKNLDARPMKTLEDNGVDLRAYAKLLASLKGVSLRVSFTDDVTGNVTIDLGQDTALIAPFVKPLVLETLSRVGLNVVEFSNWKFTASGTHIVGEGKLTTFTLKRLLSLADAPVPATLDPETPADEPAPASEKDATLAATKAYYKKATAILDNIHKAPSLGEQATWMRRDARRLADLPILNVDKDLVAWGASVSDKLFAASRQLAGGQMTVRTTSNSIAAPNPSSSYEGNDGYYYTDDAQYSRDMDNHRKALRAATGAEYEKAVCAAAEDVDGLGATRSEIRRVLTERYGVEFK